MGYSNIYWQRLTFACPPNCQQGRYLSIFIGTVCKCSANLEKILHMTYSIIFLQLNLSLSSWKRHLFSQRNHPIAVSTDSDQPSRRIRRHPIQSRRAKGSRASWESASRAPIAPCLSCKTQCQADHPARAIPKMPTVEKVTDFFSIPQFWGASSEWWFVSTDVKGMIQRMASAFGLFADGFGEGK
jgi:hypothetical protein